MIFRPADRSSAGAARRDAILAAAERVFGRHPDEIQGDAVEVDGLTYVFAPSDGVDGQLPFVLRPECDRCGAQDIDQFPLERWSIGGAEVWAQSRTTCRACRFRLLATSEAPPLDLTPPRLFGAAEAD